MGVYLIKHTGASIERNMYFDRSFEFNDGGKIYVSIVFFRKKDAEKYLKTLEHNEFFLVVGATMDKVESDNRKLK